MLVLTDGGLFTIIRRPIVGQCPKLQDNRC